MVAAVAILVDFANAREMAALQVWWVWCICNERCANGSSREELLLLLKLV